MRTNVPVAEFRGFGFGPEPRIAKITKLVVTVLFVIDFVMRVTEEIMVSSVDRDTCPKWQVADGLDPLLGSTSCWCCGRSGILASELVRPPGQGIGAGHPEDLGLLAGSTMFG